MSDVDEVRHLSIGSKAIGMTLFYFFFFFLIEVYQHPVFDKIQSSLSASRQSVESASWTRCQELSVIGIYVDGLGQRTGEAQELNPETPHTAQRQVLVQNPGHRLGASR